MIVVSFLLVGVALGAVCCWLALRTRIRSLEGDLHVQTAEAAGAAASLASARTALELERGAAAEKLALLEQAKDELADAFKALSSEALQSNNSSFLELARTVLERFQVQARDDLEQRQKAVETLVLPLRDSLEKVDGQIQQLERARSHAHGALTQQLRTLAETHERLRAETGNLVSALRTPAARGRWGEIQLRRVVEMAGMVAHCDFVEQTTATVDDRRLRPDLVVRLPGGKNVVVDAKVPLAAYLQALEAPDEETRLALLRDHARQLRAHMTSLSMKGYWEQFRPAPEFVVLFVPGEAIYGAALEQDPALIEDGVARSVLIASPVTLIGVLQGAAYGWRQETVAESARAVSELGRELHGRIATLGDHFVSLGKRLDGAVQAYNQAVGSLERRVLPAARRFEELGAGGARDVPALASVERAPQLPRAPELQSTAPAASPGDPPALDAAAAPDDENDPGREDVRDAA